MSIIAADASSREGLPSRRPDLGLPSDMTIRWDALLVRELARELSARLSGRRLRALRLDGSTRVLTLLFRHETLVWHLHPTRGDLRVLPVAEPDAGDLPLPSRVRAVRSPTDERILVFELVHTRGRRQWSLVVELLGNQWNALVTEAPADTIRHVLVRRERPRVLRVGSTYAPPAPSSREGGEAPMDPGRWRDIVEPPLPADRARELISRVAWTSPINAAALLGSDGEGAVDMPTGRALWISLAFPEEGARPVLLELTRGLQPYPWPLPGVPSRPAQSLLEALGEAVVPPSGEEDAHGAGLLPAATLAALESAVDEALRRCTRLQAELDRAEDPDALRARGDLLLARLDRIPSGSDEVTLEDFDGSPLSVRIDPRLSGPENAAAYYERASRATRTRKRLPSLLSRARRDARSLEELLARARAGDADAEEVRGALPEAPKRRRGPGGAPSAPPYHRYVSSGGLEIRVGRGASLNDDLTFRHSAPDDVWLHARHSAGAHVILRWGKPGSPPGRDLEEAAVLAALNSKARTAGTVPVDWTLRKYVRKPRGAPPGTVVPQRVKTVFVAPDPDVAERLTPP